MLDMNVTIPKALGERIARLVERGVEALERLAPPQVEREDPGDGLSRAEMDTALSVVGNVEAALWEIAEQRMVDQGRIYTEEDVMGEIRRMRGEE